ncbi:DMT family transporter [Roseovarius indicus]|uniref:Carboxylate/amino acid/amine transporter n=1 Tax=Roseovarius indicus TaxID=540747 RepID=A0A0T5PEJ8_9RHOB|nr:DMT family transporter [Roseovarius indicus]KRS19689.1 membrane protein [Roseovarius indicus]QEW28966.1 carboxylate/amino acid/amine transporter [Roseovarius indicus]SFD81985.1 EamA-like transporter family protein [Roseovarius indicus]
MTEAMKGHLAMLCFSMLIAGSFALGSMAANHIAPTVLNAVRFLAAAVILGIAAHVVAGIPCKAFAAPWRYLLLGGSMGLYFVLMFEGLKTAEPVSAAAVFTLTPILSGVFGYLLLRQVTTGRMALALTVGAVGALWVIFDASWQDFTAFDVGRGEMVYFWGCVAHAVYTPMVRLLNRGEKPVVFSFGALVGAALLLTVAAWPDLRTTDWATLPPIVWITIGYTALLATALTTVLLQFASLRLPSAKVMAYTYLTPTWVACWQAALGKGVPPGMVLLGVGMTVVALVLLLKDEHPG